MMSKELAKKWFLLGFKSGNSLLVDEEEAGPEFELYWKVYGEKIKSGSKIRVFDLNLKEK